MAQPPNPGPAAQTYSELAAVLAGFAFAALILYLGSQRSSSDSNSPDSAPPDSLPYAAVTPRRVVISLFYAMSALTISSFLYGRLASESTASGRTYLVFALYGVVLALAVLSLFYALNLVMVVTRKETREAAEQTRWVVAAVGPAVVISLLADLLASAWDYGCQEPCSAWQSPRWWGFGLALVFLIIGLWTTVQTLRTLKNFIGDLVTWVLRLPWIKRGADAFQRHPQIPGLIAIIFAALVGIASLWVRGTPDGYNPSHWTHALLVVTALVLGLFAFAAATVLDQASSQPVRSRDGRWRKSNRPAASGTS
ncbi:MAG: hypothetical protein ACRD0P_08660 [Stackebrandtia sp.]